MKKTTRWSMLIMLAFVLVLAGLAQQKSDETAVDPVCGMTVKKATAKATLDYQGKTYYFCAEGCKEAFAKNQEKYLTKTEQAKPAYTCPMHPEVTSSEPGKCPKCGMALKQATMPHEQMMASKRMSGCPMMGRGRMMHGQMMPQGRMGRCGCRMTAAGPGCGMDCPLGSADVEIKTENSSDGVAVRISSKNPETVKKIQEHFAAGMKHCPMGCCALKVAK